MSKKNRNPETPMDETVDVPAKQPKKKKKKKGGGFLGRLIRRFFLIVFTVVILAAAALVLVLNMILNGPSPAAQEVLTMSLIEASATKWVPALFIGEERVAEIRTSVNQELPQDVSSSTKVVIQKGSALSATNDEWAKYPDGIRIIRRIMSMPNVKMLLGNHEYMMLQALDSDADKWERYSPSNKYIHRWYRNGAADVHHR